MTGLTGLLLRHKTDSYLYNLFSSFLQVFTVLLFIFTRTYKSFPQLFRQSSTMEFVLLFIFLISVNCSIQIFSLISITNLLVLLYTFLWMRIKLDLFVFESGLWCCKWNFPKLQSKLSYISDKCITEGILQYFISATTKSKGNDLFTLSVGTVNSNPGVGGTVASTSVINQQSQPPSLLANSISNAQLQESVRATEFSIFLARAGEFWLSTSVKTSSI